jgi:hypothetical protein
MKKFVIAAIVISTIVFASCEPAATFNKPQPDNTQSLANFPETLHGKYMDNDQASVITITDKLITRYYDFEYKGHKDSLDSNYKMVGDTIIDLSAGTKQKVLVWGDSIRYYVNLTDTLFNVSADQVLKKFKGYYLLNTKYSDSAWEVKKLSLQKGILKFAAISIPDDLLKLREITEHTTDTTSTHFSLTKRQFKSFLHQDGFREEEAFTRIRESGKD